MEFVLFFLVYDIHLYFSLYNHSLCTGRVCLLSLENRGSQAKVSAFRNKLYLQMLHDGTCLIVPSAGDFRILSCMLKTVSITFLHIAF